MHQLTQNLKIGAMKLFEVPALTLTNKNIRVKVHYSLISAGTESSKVTTARKGYLGKAKEKPEQVKQELGTIKKEGLANTYRRVMNKLDAWSLVTDHRILQFMFTLPLRSWIRGPLKEMIDDYLSYRSIQRRGLCEPSYVRTKIQLDREGKEDDAHLVWQLLTHELWFRTFFKP